MRHTITGVALLAGVCLFSPRDLQAGARGATSAVENLVSTGSAAWNRSCTTGGVLCTQTRALRSHRRCTGSATHVSVLARASRGAAAQKRLRRAIAIYRRVHNPTSQLAAAAAPAFLYAADADHERFLRTRYPRHLSFDPADNIGTQLSKIRLERWVVNLQSNVAHLIRVYAEAAAVAARGKRFDLRDQARARAAKMLARAGELLATARIPRHFFGSKYERDMIAAYCGEMSKQARPLRARAAKLRRI